MHRNAFILRIMLIILPQKVIAIEPEYCLKMQILHSASGYLMCTEMPHVSRSACYTHMRLLC